MICNISIWVKLICVNFRQVMLRWPLELHGYFILCRHILHSCFAVVLSFY